MTSIIYSLTCPKAFSNNEVKDSQNKSDPVAQGLVCLDLLIVISSLVLGILGATGVITMPPAAAYSLIGLGAFIPLVFSYMIIIGDADCYGTLGKDSFLCQR